MPINRGSASFQLIKMYLTAGVYGASLWLTGAFIIGSNPSLFSSNVSLGQTALLYAGFMPITWVSIKVFKYIGIKEDQTVKATAFATAVACVLDGIAMVALPQLYGNPDNAKPGAFLLFAVGMGIFYSFLIEKLAKKTKKE